MSCRHDRDRRRPFPACRGVVLGVLVAVALLMACAGCATPIAHGSPLNSTCEPLSTALEAAAANDPQTYRTYRARAEQAAGRLVRRSPGNDAGTLDDFARALAHLPMARVQRAEAGALRVPFARVRGLCSVAEKVPGD